jgi:hypothetical protein
MVIEILVAQGQGIDPLGDEMLKGVLDQLGVTMVDKACGELADDASEFLGLAEEQATAIGGDVAAIEGSENLAGANDREIQVS